MFTTDANAGHVRINYTTDVELARSVNPNALSIGRPVISTPLTMGGYRMPILEDMAAGRTFQILKADIPADDDHEARADVDKTLRDPHTVYAYVDANKLTIVQIDGWDRAVESLGIYGWLVNASRKTFKRFKTLNRPFRLWDKPGRPLRVAIVDDTDYTLDDDMHDLEPSLQERLLDGAFVIRRDLFEGCLDNLSFPVMSGEILTADHWRAAAFKQEARKLKAFNARIFGEFHFIGGHSEIEPGMFKGQAFIDASDTCERLGVDIIAPRSAIKHEVSGRETYVLLEPQSKKPHANGDNQSICHNPALYDPRMVASWVRALMMGQFEDLKENKLLESWFQLTGPNFNSESERRYDDSDLITLTKWNARAWVMSGMMLRDSPWLFEQMAKNILSVIQTTNINKMRIPMPCAIRCQVVSQSLASMAGVDVEVLPGAIRWVKEHDVLVVSDADWLEMYESHGGMDLDDFFVGYWRTINNQRKVVIMRSPNDYGEYSIFDYVEGDWFPTEKMNNGLTVMFPIISGDPELWPERLSEAVRAGRVTYVGLPSQRQESEKEEPHPYGLADVYKAMTNNVGSQMCVGANVNARSLWSITMRQHRATQLAPMESCIDTGAQGGHALDIEAVTGEAQEILAQVLESNAPIDHYIWATRFEPGNGVPFDESRLTAKTHLTRIHNFRVKFAEEFMELIRDYVSNHVGQNANPLIHQLGARMLGHGYDLMRFSRQALVDAQGNRAATPEVWDSIHAYIRGEVEKQPTEADQHDLVMGIYSACLKVPARSTGRISDQLVMNPALFDMLMAALRYYGIAAHLFIDDNGQITRWTQETWGLACQGCGQSAETMSPLVWQAYHAKNRMCPACATD